MCEGKSARAVDDVRFRFCGAVDCEGQSLATRFKPLNVVSSRLVPASTCRCRSACDASCSTLRLGAAGSPPLSESPRRPSRATRGSQGLPRIYAFLLPHLSCREDFDWVEVLPLVYWYRIAWRRLDSAGRLLRTWPLCRWVGAQKASAQLGRLPAAMTMRPCIGEPPRTAEAEAEWLTPMPERRATTSRVAIDDPGLGISVMHPASQAGPAANAVRFAREFRGLPVFDSTCVEER